MTNVKTGQNRDVGIFEHFCGNPANLIKLTAIFKRTKNQTDNPLKASGQLHLAQHTIDSVGSLALVFKKNDLTVITRREGGSHKMTQGR